MITPFSIAIPDSDIADLKSRLARTRFPDEVEGAGWDYGMPVPVLRKIVRHWADDFDWRAEEKRLNAFAQFTTEIEGETIHFVHVKATTGHRTPLLLLNGWPSCFVELLPLIERLPEFDIVIPSLLGYGFSSRPRQKGANLTLMAGLFAALMRDLGYEKFLVSGSDLGAGVGMAMLAGHAGRLTGMHWCNVYSRYPRPPEPSKAEEEYFSRVDAWTMSEAAYAMEHATKPTTIAAALNDSPAGLAAWIVEKFHGWSDVGDDLEAVYPLDTLCSILSVYWFTQTIGSSQRLYKEVMGDPTMRAPLPPHDARQAVLVPAAPNDLPAPREWGERNLRNLVRWTMLTKGGHFPALESPDAMAADIAAFRAQLTP